MLPSEMEIMLAIALNKNIAKKLVDGSMDVISEYFGYLFNSMVKRGYIKGNRAKGYQLTLRGKTTLVKYLRKNETRDKAAIEQLKQLSIECSNKMDKLRKEGSVVN